MTVAIPPPYESTGYRRFIGADGTNFTGRLAVELPAELTVVDEPATLTRPNRSRLVFVGVPSGAVPATRLVAGTSPIRVNGGASADLSATVTISILAASGSIAGTMSSADFTKLAGIEAGAINALAGAGMTKTGSTLNVVANADGSIVVNADDIRLKVAYQTLLDGATSAATANTLAKRGASSECSFGAVAATSVSIDNGALEMNGPHWSNPQAIASAASITLHADSGATRSNHIEIASLSHDVTIAGADGWKEGAELTVIIYQGAELHTITWTSSVFAFADGLTATRLGILGQGDIYKLTRCTNGKWVIWEHRAFTPAS